MRVIVAIGIWTLVAILFYWLVERKHKIFLAKIGIAAITLGGILLAVSAYLDARAAREAQRNRWDAALAELQKLSTASMVFVGDSAVKSFTTDWKCEANASITGIRCPKTEVTTTVIIFRLCNRSKEKTITRVEFVPKTSERGRSTYYNLVNDSYSPSAKRHTLQSDRILKPGECSNENWSVFTTLKDSTFADVVGVDFEGELPDISRLPSP